MPNKCDYSSLRGDGIMTDNVKEYYEQKKYKLEFFTRTVLSPKPNIHPEL